jgi:hypothetical protein
MRESTRDTKYLIFLGSFIFGQNICLVYVFIRMGSLPFLHFDMEKGTNPCYTSRKMTGNTSTSDLVE